MSQNARVPIEDVLPIASDVVARFSKVLVYVKDFRICGSVRRNASDCGDIDVAVTREAFDVNEMFLRQQLDSYEDTAKGRLKHGFVGDFKVEFYVGPAAGFGSLVLFATGNPAFNVRCRQIANRKGWSLNQFGLWVGDTQSGNMVCDCTTEEEILTALGLLEFVNPLSRSIGGYHAH